MHRKLNLRQNLLLLNATLGATLLGAAGASANIVYTVDQIIGGGSVTGTMTTDGATGAILPTDFLSWNLELNGVGASFNLTQANSVVFERGADVNATPSEITFNFSGDDNGLFLVQDGLFQGTHYWCNATQSGACFQGKTVTPIFFSDSSTQNVPASGIQVIMTAGAVPEPSTWALMLLGFAAVSYAGYRRAQARSVAAIG